jgi:hypothetical protein
MALVMVLVGLVVVVVVVIRFMLAVEEPRLRIVLGGGLLALGYVSLHFSRYILNEGSRGFVGMGPGPGVLAFLTGPFGIACLVTSIVMLAKVWSGPLRKFTPLALVPCLLAMAYNAHETIQAEKADRERAQNWIGRWHIRKAAGCSGAESHRVEAICREIVAGLPSESAASVHTRGQTWGRNHSISDPDECRRNTRNFEYFDDDPEFIAGCVDSVAATRRSQGDFWAQQHHIMADDDCKPTALTSPEAIEGCKSVTQRNRSGEGWWWAHQNVIFTIDDCEHDVPARPDRADFVNGCEDYVRHSRSAQQDKYSGMEWAAHNPINDEAECHGRIKHASPEFEQGCEESLPALRETRKRGRAWARDNRVSSDADCDPGKRGTREHLYFVLGCKDVVRLKRDCAKDPTRLECCVLTGPSMCR